MPIYRPVSEQIRIAIQGTRQEIHAAFVSTARREHARVMDTPPKPQTFTRRVDGVLGASEEAVRHNGAIVYTYPRLDIVVQSAFLALIDKSPFLSGEYIRGHTLFVDGLAVLSGKAGAAPHASAAWFKNWRPGQEIVIANFVPYARKIELGRMTMRVPGTDHVYEQAQQIVQRRHGNLASIRYTWHGVIGAGHNAGLTRDRAKNKHRGDDNRWPALVIKEKL